MKYHKDLLIHLYEENFDFEDIINAPFGACQIGLGVLHHNNELNFDSIYCENKILLGIVLAISGVKNYKWTGEYKEGHKCLLIALENYNQKYIENIEKEHGIRIVKAIFLYGNKNIDLTIPFVVLVEEEKLKGIQNV